MSVFPTSPLLSSVNERFCIMEKTRIPDGIGGSKLAWRNGMEFDVAPTLDSSTEARIGEVQGLTSVYTFFVPKGLDLQDQDYIKRLKDGAVFRVKSPGTEQQAPSISAMNMEFVAAERAELP